MRERRFSASVARLGGRSTLVLSGELDLLTRGEVEIAAGDARRAGAPIMVVDARELDFLDCAGLSAIIALARQARAGGERLTVLVGAGFGRRALDLLDLGTLIDVVDEEAAAGSAADPA